MPWRCCSATGRPRVVGAGPRPASSDESVAAALRPRSGLPAPAVTGVRFALEPGVGRNAVPVRSAILGAALAVIVVVATVTFSASLNSLVSHPRLYGWNWDSILAAGGGSGNIPDAQAGQTP